jgi:hypothetical protein
VSSISPYIKEHLKNYSKLEHLTALMQPRKYLEDTFKTEVWKNLKTPSEVLRSLQYSAMKCSRAC